MKVAVINDTHFGARGDKSTFLNNFEKFYDNVFFPTIDEHEIEIILHLGDTFDRRKYLNYHTMSRVEKMFLGPMLARGIEYHSIAGNHDCYFKNTNSVNSPEILVEPLSDYFHVHHSSPKTLKLDGLKILMVPWINNENKVEIFNALKKTDASVVMGHFELTGFEMQRGQTCKKGMGTKIFDKFDAVYSGHFHHPSSKGNIRYLGAPYEMDWSDAECKRGFHILDTKDGSMEFIENPYTTFQKIIYNDEGWTIDEMKEFEFDDLSDNYIKVLVEKKDDPYMFDIFIDKLEDCGPADIKIVEDNALVLVESDGETDLDVEDTKDILNGYVNDLSISDDQKNSVKDYTLTLYNEAITS